MSRQPFDYYVDIYNLSSKNVRKDIYRFTKDGWRSLMQYRQREIDDAVEAAKKVPRLELLREASRLKFYCKLHSQGVIGGQALRSYDCQQCGRHETWPNTATPQFCEYCAFKGFKCQYCGEPLR